VSAGKQIVLTSDRAPAEIPDLEARLRSRFDGGLVVPIQSPDRTLRERLFDRFLKAAGRHTDAALLSVLGEQQVLSVREIIGMVNRLGAAADTNGIQLSAQMVRSELGMPTPYAGGPTVRPANDTRDTSFLDREKIIWEWPDVTARVIEEFR
jgi:chromosomal replication initiation ATPase DnaA